MTNLSRAGRLATVEGMMNSVLISDGGDGHFSSLNGDEPRHEVFDRAEWKQGLGQGLGQGHSEAHLDLGDAPGSAPSPTTGPATGPATGQGLTGLSAEN